MKFLLLSGGKAEQAACFPHGTALKCRLQALGRPASLSPEMGSISARAVLRKFYRRVGTSPGDNKWQGQVPPSVRARGRPGSENIWGLPIPKKV